MYQLLAHPGWGSSIVEAMLELARLPYAVEDIDPIKSSADREKLRALNPLLQIPTLLMPDGSVMTESAAIALHVADHAPAAGLVPPAGDATRDRFLRWLVFLVASIYPTFTMGDDPTRWVSDKTGQSELLARSDAYRESMWRQIEAAIDPKPWFLGSRFSALDVYLCAMTHWRPRRAWFAANCPKVGAIALATDALPSLAKVWKRNFG